jgi:hypothetical protein
VDHENLWMPFVPTALQQLWTDDSAAFAVSGATASPAVAALAALTVSVVPSSQLAAAPQSYAGKYVPSIAHYIVQAAAMHDGSAGQLRKQRALSPDVEAPVFKLGGLAIGNGFTDAVKQTLVQVRGACTRDRVCVGAGEGVCVCVKEQEYIHSTKAGGSDNQGTRGRQGWGMACEMT